VEGAPSGDAGGGPGAHTREGGKNALLGGAGIALALVVVISFLTPYVEFVVLGTQLGSFAPAGNAILPLLILALLADPVLARIRPSCVVGRRRLVYAYAILLMVASLASCQFAQWVVPVCTGPRYYATPFNGWQQFLGLVPTWWAPGDAQDIRRFYEGLKVGETVRWAVWWRPLLAWGPFVLALYGTVLCILSLLRKAWIEDERLPFPLVQLPIELTRADAAGRPAVFANRLVWLGAALPLTVHSLNGLHHIAPSVPGLAVRDAFHIGLYLASPPWNAVTPVWIDVYFCLIGFAFLSARDVPFSMWVFYLLFKIECLAGAYWGWTPGGEDRSLTGDTFPLIEAQQVGAVLAMVGIVLWTARRRLGDAWRKALRPGDGVRDDDEAIPYRVAVLGACAGFVFLTGWCVTVGMPAWVAALTMAVSLLFLIGVHRMMAEGGVNFLWAAQSGPNYLFHSLGGARFLSAKSWMLLLDLPYFAWNFKGPVGPQALEAFKLAQETGFHPRRLVMVGMAGMVLTAVLSYWSVVYLVHTHGGGVALDSYRFVHVGQRPFTELSQVLSCRAALSLPKLIGISAAALATWFIGWMRWIHPWWRLHPLGYAASTIWAMNFMWFSMFIGSTASWLLTRAGGLSLYRRARPFFLGLILGDFAAMGLWTVVNALLGVRGFVIFGL